jgi:hypothetical protein
LKYVAILKKVVDLESKTPEQAKLPDNYPIQMVEFDSESRKEAQDLYPDKKIMTALEYRGYQMALAELYEEAQSKESFWDRLKFWQ